MPDEPNTGQETAEAPATETTETAPAETPDWTAGVPEKFRRDTPEETAKALAEGYTNLEKVASKPAGPTSIPPPDVAPDMTTNDFIAGLGLDPAEVGKAFTESGKLPDDAYKKLNGRGISNKMADEMYGAMQLAGEYKQQQVRATAAAIAGGNDELDALLSWAGNNLDEDKTNALNARLGDPAQVEGVLYQLLAEKAKAEGTRPGLVESTPTAPTAGATAFASNSEMRAAMKAAKDRHGGNWQADAQFMARYNKTPASVRTALR